MHWKFRERVQQARGTTPTPPPLPPTTTNGKKRFVMLLPRLQRRRVKSSLSINLGELRAMLSVSQMGPRADFEFLFCVNPFAAGALDHDCKVGFYGSTICSLFVVF